MKPTVVFTNFFDANILVQDKYMTYCFNESPEARKFYIVLLNNYQVYSIALGIPESSKIPFLKNIFRINHFCPTYSLLMEYKKDQDWKKYREEYRKLLVSRKDDINDWIECLEQDKIYILCCWEDTSKKCNCHRKVLFDALRSTGIWKDKAIWVYRNGNSKYLRMYPKKQDNTTSYLESITGMPLPIPLDGVVQLPDNPIKVLSCGFSEITANHTLSSSVITELSSSSYTTSNPTSESYYVTTPNNQKMP